MGPLKVAGLVERTAYSTIDFPVDKPLRLVNTDTDFEFIVAVPQAPWYTHHQMFDQNLKAIV